MGGSQDALAKTRRGGIRPRVSRLDGRCRLSLDCLSFRGRPASLPRRARAGSVTLCPPLSPHPEKGVAPSPSTSLYAGWPGSPARGPCRSVRTEGVSTQRGLAHAGPLPGMPPRPSPAQAVVPRLGGPLPPARGPRGRAAAYHRRCFVKVSSHRSLHPPSHRPSSSAGALAPCWGAARGRVFRAQSVLVEDMHEWGAQCGRNGGEEEPVAPQPQAEAGHLPGGPGWEMLCDVGRVT